MSTIIFAAMTLLIPGGTIASYPSAQLYVPGVNVAADWNPATHGFAGLTGNQYFAPSSPFREDFRGGSVGGTGYYELLLQPPNGPERLVASVFAADIEVSTQGFRSAISTPDGSFAAGTILSADPTLPTTWIWDEKQGLRYLVDALAASPLISPDELKRLAIVNELSVDGKRLSGVYVNRDRASSNRTFYLDLGTAANVPTPEPASIAVWAVAVGLVWRRRRQGRSSPTASA